MNLILHPEDELNAEYCKLAENRINGDEHKSNTKNRIINTFTEAQNDN